MLSSQGRTWVLVAVGILAVTAAAFAFGRSARSDGPGASAPEVSREGKPVSVPGLGKAAALPAMKRPPRAPEPAAQQAGAEPAPDATASPRQSAPATPSAPAPSAPSAPSSPAPSGGGDSGGGDSGVVVGGGGTE